MIVDRQQHYLMLEHKSTSLLQQHSSKLINAVALLSPFWPICRELALQIFIFIFLIVLFYLCFLLFVSASNFAILDNYCIVFRKFCLLNSKVCVAWENVLWFLLIRLTFIKIWFVGICILFYSAEQICERFLKKIIAFIDNKNVFISSIDTFSWGSNMSQSSNHMKVYRCKSFSKNDQLFTGFHFPCFIQKCSNHTTAQQKRTNYKPISNLSFLSKIFEKMFIKNWMNIFR